MPAPEDYRVQALTDTSHGVPVSALTNLVVVVVVP